MTKLEREIRQLLKHESRKQRAYLWGEYCVFTPVILSKQFGDGLQIIYFGSIDQRPKFWIARIDSKTDIDNLDYEEILCAIEEEFGRIPEPAFMDYKQFREYIKSKPFFFDYQSYSEYKTDCQYPSITWGGGHCGLIKNFGCNGQ